MKSLQASLALLGLLQSALVSAAGAPNIAPGAPCSGSVAYCAASDIILRCSYGTLQAGNCNDNLDEPPLGALCVDSAPSGGSATCVAITASSTSSSPSVTATSSTASASPTVAPGAPCTGVVAYCVGGSGGSDIILRCGAGGTLEPGNCADNLDEPPFGAVCVDSAPPPGGLAQCKALSGPSSSSSASTSASVTQSQSSGHSSPTGVSSTSSAHGHGGSGSTPPTTTTTRVSNGTVATATLSLFTGAAVATGANWHFEAVAAFGAVFAAAF